MASRAAKLPFSFFIPSNMSSTDRETKSSPVGLHYTTTVTTTYMYCAAVLLAVCPCVSGYTMESVLKDKLN